jgi:hypothetical protein
MGHGTVKCIQEWRNRQVKRPYILALSGTRYEASPYQIAGYYSVMADARWNRTIPPRSALRFLLPSEQKTLENVVNAAIRAAKKAREDQTKLGIGSQDMLKESKAKRKGSEMKVSQQLNTKYGCPYSPTTRYRSCSSVIPYSCRRARKMSEHRRILREHRDDRTVARPRHESPSRTRVGARLRDSHQVYIK